MVKQVAQQSSAGRQVDLDAVLDQGNFNPFLKSLLVISAFIMFADGFDINNIGFAAPALVKAWGSPIVPRSDRS